MDVIKTKKDLYYSSNNGRNLILSPSFGTWAIVNEEFKKVINFFYTYQGTVDDAVATFKLPIVKVKAIVENGFKNGFLEINGKFKFDDNEVTKRIDINTYPQLCILHISNKCNLYCKYCYAQTNSGHAKSMSIETLKKSIDRFMELPSKVITIEFHGGEPLIHYKKILVALEYATNAALQFGKKVIFAMQSNMTFLNEECIDLIKKYNVQIRISLDGPKDINDQNRVYNNGRGTFDDILTNLMLLSRHGIYPEVVAVVSKHNVDRLLDVVKLFTELNLYRVRLIPLWSQGKGKDISNEQVDLKYYVKKYLELLEWIIVYNKANINIPAKKIKMLALRMEIETLSGFKRSFMCLRCPCGAGINMIDVSVDGDIYPCEEMNEIKGLKIGNIYQNNISTILDQSHIIKMLKARTPEAIEDCKDCFWRRFCQSGCANKNYNLYGRFDSRSEKCDFYKNYFEELIWFIDRNRGLVKYLA